MQMKKSLYIFFVLIAVSCGSKSKTTNTSDASYRLVDMDENLTWIKELKKYPLQKFTSDGIDINDSLNVFIKYTPDVQGYDVYGRFLPYSDDSETGYAILVFKRGESSFTYTCDKWNEDNTGKISKWENNQVYEFDYVSPKNKYGAYANSPFGYYTPFQFYDIDFDGEKEFIANDYRLGKGGNDYIPYKIESGRLAEMNYVPFNSICSLTEFDVDNNQIVNHFLDGAYFSATIYYTRKNQTVKPIQSLPSFRTSILQENWGKCLMPIQPFTIDSIVETVSDTVFTYHRIGTSLHHTKTAIRNQQAII